MTELFTVFGADGFVGRRLVARLAGQGHVVQPVGRDDDFLKKRANLGHVLYCAGVTGSRFKTEQFRVVDAHVSAMAKVLEHAKYESFLYMSSARTYEESLEGTSESAQFRVDPSRISDFYNLSKLMGESLILNSGVNSARIVRVSYAVDIADDSTDNITEFVRAARSGMVRFLAHRDSVKDYVVMEDILSVMPHIALHGEATTYNVASGRNTSTREIAEMLVEETGCAVDFADEESIRSPLPIDVTLLKREMSFSPQSVLDYARRVIRSEVRP
jgi:nucleoside-diphosphate-sugar epimerase